MTEDNATQAKQELDPIVLLMSVDHSIDIDELCLYILKLLEYCIVELFYIHFACIYVFFFFAFIGLFVIIKYENILSLVKIY
jgi:membrane glycosyltransferase